MLKLRTGDKVPNHEEKMQEQRGKSPFAEATYLEHVRKKKNCFTLQVPIGAHNSLET